MNKDNQLSSVPKSLISLLSMIVNGPASRTVDSEDVDVILLSLAQLISFHAVKRTRNGPIKRHDKSRENPVPVKQEQKS